MMAPRPIGSVQEALKLIDAFSGNPEGFELTKLGKQFLHRPMNEVVIRIAGPESGTG
jgi:hypothetical protein